MIMDCIIRYKNMMLIAKMKFEEFILKLVHTDLRSQTTTVPHQIFWIRPWLSRMESVFDGLAQQTSQKACLLMPLRMP
jgi:hypothetical protein